MAKQGAQWENHILPDIDCKIQRGATEEVSSANNSIG